MTRNPAARSASGACHLLRSAVGLAGLIVLSVPSQGFAGFYGTDVFLPSVGGRPGVPPAVWYTTVWVHNPDTTPADLTFYLLERQENLAPRTFTDTLPAGETRRYDDAVRTMFVLPGDVAGVGVLEVSDPLIPR